jgi:hypothetical protein
MKQKNELATLSPKQSNPYTALPEDFVIVRDGSAFHGQESQKLQKTADAECHRTTGQKRSTATETSDAGKPRTPGMSRDEN